MCNKIGQISEELALHLKMGKNVHDLQFHLYNVLTDKMIQNYVNFQG